MRLQRAAFLLLPAAISAERITVPPQATQTAIGSIATPSQQLSIASISTIPSTYTPSSIHAWDPLISGVNQVLHEINEHLHIDLKKRQGGVAITVAPVAVATTVPTQMSPITTYFMNDVGNIVYTQLFSAVPDQWTSPQAGAVGLGTITGQVGVVKTNSKRALLAEPTAKPEQILRIKGREVRMS